MNTYNEIEPFCNEWIENLMIAGEIPLGRIDARPIQEIRAADLEGVTQFHTFAGIAGWSLALRMAGWPEDEEVWSGSCPCQPFSAAGKRGGQDDKRHLWPELRRLISLRRPATVFGEQVASKDGREWMAKVRFDLEKIRYWTEFYESLQQVLEAKTEKTLSEILGSIIGRVETSLFQVSERVRIGMALEASNGGKDASANSLHSASKRRSSQGTDSHRRGETTLSGKRSTVRSGSIRSSGKNKNSEGRLRDDGASVQFQSSPDIMGQSVDRSDNPKSWVYLPQHPNRLLWDKCGPGELGGVGAIRDSQSLAGKEKRLNNERRISDTFGILIEASVERLRLAGVRADLEKLGYRVGVADLSAAGVGAPHIRQRLYWVAYSLHAGRPEWGPGSGEGSLARSGGDLGLAHTSRSGHGQYERNSGTVGREAAEGQSQESESGRSAQAAGNRRQDVGMADAPISELRRIAPTGKQPADQQDDGARGLAVTDERGRRGRRDADSSRDGRQVQAEGRSSAGGLGNAAEARRDYREDSGADRGDEKADGSGGDESVRAGTLGRVGDAGRDNLGRLSRGASGEKAQGHRGGEEDGTRGLVSRSAGDFGPWSDSVILDCTDGKSRRTGCGVFPLAHGLPRSLGLVQSRISGLGDLAGLDAASLKRAKTNRLHRLKGYGNAIVPWLAAEFIVAYREARGDMAALSDLL